MKPKGWRNNPQWIEFYKRQEEERQQRQSQRAKMESQMRQFQLDLANDMARLKKVA